MRPRRHARHFPDRPTLWSWRGMLRAAGDPLVQTWGLVVFSFILVGGHYAGTVRAREQKKLPHSPQYLTAGFAPPGQHAGLSAVSVTTQRPVISLRRQARPVPAATGEAADLLATEARVVRDEVASAPAWKYLHQALRDRIAEATGPGSRAPQLSLIWSGEAAGNAEVLGWHQRRVQRGRGETPHFVIGNGTRSGDGMIESLTAPARASDSVGAEIRICLIGTGRLTSAQRQALGELIVWIEARCGAAEISAR